MSNRNNKWNKTILILGGIVLFIAIPVATDLTNIASNLVSVFYGKDSTKTDDLFNHHYLIDVELLLKLNQNKSEVRIFYSGDKLSEKIAMELLQIFSIAGWGITEMEPFNHHTIYGITLVDPQFSKEFKYLRDRLKDRLSDMELSTQVDMYKESPIQYDQEIKEKNNNRKEKLDSNINDPNLPNIKKVFDAWNVYLNSKRIFIGI